MPKQQQPRSTSPAKGAFFHGRVHELEDRTAALNYYYGIEQKYQKPSSIAEYFPGSLIERPRNRAKLNQIRSVSSMSEQPALLSSASKQLCSQSVQILGPDDAQSVVTKCSEPIPHLISNSMRKTTSEVQRHFQQQTNALSPATRNNEILYMSKSNSVRQLV